MFENIKPVGIRGKIFPKFNNKNNGIATHYNLGDDLLYINYFETEGNSAFLKKEYLKFGGMNPLLFGGEGFELSYKINKEYGYGKLIYNPA